QYMPLVLAIEPDSSQADPLSSVVCARLGAELALVTSTYAAIASMNQRLPDLVLFGSAVSPEQRLQIAAHLRSFKGPHPIPTLDTPPLAHPTTDRSGLQEQPRTFNTGAADDDVAFFTKQLEIHLAAADDEALSETKSPDLEPSPDDAAQVEVEAEI